MTRKADKVVQAAEQPKSNGNGSNAFKHSQKELLAYAKAAGLDAQGLGKALGAAGFKEVDLARFDEMKAAIDAYKA